jgi:hypothetical protein
MEQLGQYQFLVQPAELVTIRVNLVGTTGLVSAALTGSPLENTGTKYLPQFRFSASTEPGRHELVGVSFLFAPEAAPDARYEILVEGEQGGTFQLPPIRREPTMQRSGVEITLDFRTSSTGPR